MGKKVNYEPLVLDVSDTELVDIVKVIEKSKNVMLLSLKLQNHNIHANIF